MKPKSKIVVAMSGGVDSSVAACLLQEQGFEVVGFFMRMGFHEIDQCDTGGHHTGCCSAADAADARLVAGKLGVNFYALNFEREFDHIIDYFASEYTQGRTPNPCVLCNSQLKFGRLIDYANSIGADFIATGHYVQIGNRGNRKVLRRAVDRKKDQSYYLFGLNSQSLDRSLFPLGELTKDQVREHARRFGLPLSEKPESMEICFVPGRDYSRVVRERSPEAARTGPVVDPTGQVVGEHQGVFNFTIGQRRGLGIAFGVPFYVTGIDATTNTVTVGPREYLMRRGLMADQTNWFIDPPVETFLAKTQIRYQHAAVPAEVTPTDDGGVRVIFEERQSAVTPGQAVVLYDGDDCLGGAWIRRAIGDE